MLQKVSIIIIFFVCFLGWIRGWMKISFRCSYENLVVFCVCVYCCCCCCVFGECCWEEGGSGHQSGWTHAEHSPGGGGSILPISSSSSSSSSSLCSSLVFPPSVTQDFAYVYKTEATDWLSFFFFSSTDCMWRYYEKLSRRKTAGEMLHARTFFIFLFWNHTAGK